MSDFWNKVPFPNDWGYIDANMPQEVYRKHAGVSSTEIKTLERYSMLHLKNGKGSGIAQVTADQGNAVHALCLHEAYLVDCINTDNRRGAVWSVPAEESREKGHVPLPRPDFARAQASAAALMQNGVIGPYLQDEDNWFEVSMFATHPRTGVPLKARPDVYVPDRKLMIDIKTTTTCLPSEWQRDFHKYLYGLQAYHYMTVARLNGLPVENFVFAVVEKDAPFATHPFNVTPEVLEWAEEIVERCLDEMLADWNCLEPSTNWPAYTDIYLPNWLKS